MNPHLQKIHPHILPQKNLHPKWTVTTKKEKMMVLLLKILEEACLEEVVFSEVELVEEVLEGKVEVHLHIVHPKNLHLKRKTIKQKVVLVVEAVLAVEETVLEGMAVSVVKLMEETPILKRAVQEAAAKSYNGYQKNSGQNMLQEEAKYFAS